MNARHVTEATLRVRDALYEGLLIRKGLELTEEVARERANNLATAVLEVLRQLAEESKPPPVRRPTWPAHATGTAYGSVEERPAPLTEEEMFADDAARATPGQDVNADETSDEHARRLIR